MAPARLCFCVVQTISRCVSLGNTIFTRICVLLMIEILLAYFFITSLGLSHIGMPFLEIASGVKVSIRDIVEGHLAAR